MRLHDVPGQDVAILNVYAPHTPAERCALWLELISSLPRDYRSTLSGDWNFVERKEDKSNQRESYMTKEEKRVFQELKEIFHVADASSLSNRITFSSDNRRRDGNRVMAGLDRFYTFSNMEDPTSRAN